MQQLLIRPLILPTIFDFWLLEGPLLLYLLEFETLYYSDDVILLFHQRLMENQSLVPKYVVE